jgi:hypothetical protein
VLKNWFFAGILKVNDENSRIRIQDPDPDPDLLVRGMDPRIRIHPKMSWISNTADRLWWCAKSNETYVKTCSHVAGGKFKIDRENTKKKIGTR